MRPIVLTAVLTACVATSASAGQNGGILPQVRLRPPVAMEALATPTSAEATDERPAPHDGVEVRYVVRDGAVFIHFDALNVDVPFAGGGAGGCWTVDLDGRIRASREYAEVLKAMESPAQPTDTAP